MKKFIVCIVNNLCDAGIVGTIESSTDSTAKERTQTKEQAGVLVKRIGRVLRHSTDFTRVESISGARCPVVKFVHSPSGIKCDLSVNNRLAAD